jgi:hypothetical protein
VLINGKKVQHLKNFKWNSRKYAEQIKNMDGVGFIDVIPDNTFSFDYVIPAVSPKLDWSDIDGDTFIVLLKSGQRITFSGVKSLEDGEMPFDGEKESGMTIVFGYDDVVIE